MIPSTGYLINIIPKTLVSWFCWSLNGSICFTNTRMNSSTKHSNIKDYLEVASPPFFRTVTSSEVFFKYEISPRSLLILTCFTNFLVYKWMQLQYWIGFRSWSSLFINIDYDKSISSFTNNADTQVVLKCTHCADLFSLEGEVLLKTQPTKPETSSGLGSELVIGTLL